MISRRRFLSAGTVAAIGAAVGSAVSVKAAFAKGKSGMQAPTREFFDGLVGTEFRVQQDAMQSVTLRLAEVDGKARGPAKGLPGHDQFSLLFKGPAATPLPQQTYRMEHAEAGDLAIFIVPIGRQGDVVTYEAAFHCPVAGA